MWQGRGFTMELKGRETIQGIQGGHHVERNGRRVSRTDSIPFYCRVSVNCLAPEDSRSHLANTRTIFASRSKIIPIVRRCTFVFYLLFVLSPRRSSVLLLKCCIKRNSSINYFTFSREISKNMENSCFNGAVNLFKK